MCLQYQITYAYIPTSMIHERNGMKLNFLCSVEIATKVTHFVNI